MTRPNLAKPFIRIFTSALSYLAFSFTSYGYERITDSEEIVLNKLFTKKGKVELDAKFGVVLNTSYTQTFIATGGVTYFFSEEWGFSGEATAAVNSDKPERLCIETFFNKPEPEKLTDTRECLTDPSEPSPFDNTTGLNNFGPAYVPIRELQGILTGNAVWNPLYGKQIILLSATSYFDFFLKTGLGVAISQFYPQRLTIKGDDTRKARNRDFTQEGGQAGNAGTLDTDLIGINGRPEPLQQTSPLLHLAIGQRFHFLKRFMLHASIDNYTLIADGIDNFLTISGGVGVRF